MNEEFNLWERVGAICEAQDKELEGFKVHYDEGEPKLIEIFVYEGDDFDISWNWLNRDIEEIRAQYLQYKEQQEIVERHKDMALIKVLKQKYPEEFQ